MIWEYTPPRAVGWYLCAWAMGDGYVYEVAKWDGSSWFKSMAQEPTAWQEISSPANQEQMLNELYEADERLH